MPEKVPLYPLEKKDEVVEEGFLQIRVTAAGEAIPIENATVNIFKINGDEENPTLIYTLVTDKSSLTPIVALPAPPASLSEHRQVDVKPYAEYLVKVTADEYLPATEFKTKIFSGIRSIQPSVLVPQRKVDPLVEEVI